MQTVKNIFTCFQCENVPTVEKKTNMKQYLRVLSSTQNALL